MNTPTESGLYWAIINEEWEIVSLDTFDDIDKTMWTIYRLGNECAYDMRDIKQWGERVERKEATL